MAAIIENIKLMNDCIRKVKQQLEHHKSDPLHESKLLLQEAENRSLLTPPNTDPDSPASDLNNKDFGDYIDEPLNDEHINLSTPSSASSSASSSHVSHSSASSSSSSCHINAEPLVCEQSLISIASPRCITRSKVIEKVTTITSKSLSILTPPDSYPSSAASSSSCSSSVSLKVNKINNHHLDTVVSSRASSVCTGSQEEESCSATGSLTFVCKWQNCDWPGVSDDLVDHIREIHVDLQPYAYHEQQQLPPHNFRNVLRRAAASSSSSAFSSSQSSYQTQESNSNNTQSSYVCLWQGCKVYGKGSLCKSWLENHVLQHSGPRPFKCIFDRCGQRFKTRPLLEKHVNTHFGNGCGNCDFCRSLHMERNSSVRGLTSNDLNNCAISTSGSTSNCLNMLRSRPNGAFSGHHTSSGLLNGCLNSGMFGQLTPSKQAKKKKMAKLRRRPFARSTDDLFDECTMQKLRRSLFAFNSMTGLDATSDTKMVTFNSKIVGRCREEESGKTKVLLRWEPENILDDVWVNETEVSKMSVKKVPLSLLPADSSDKILDLFFVREPRTHIKQKRK